MITKATYIAEDGKEFDNEFACRRHENDLYKAKRAEVEKRFREHFSDDVDGISDEMTRYITDSCEAYVYSFTPFEGWQEVLEKYSGCFETNLWGVRGYELEEGKKYLAFCNDSLAYIVDPVYIRELINKELDSWKY